MEGDVTDPDPGSAIAIATVTEEEEGGGAAPIDGRETVVHAIGTAVEEVVEEIVGRVGDGTGRARSTAEYPVRIQRNGSIARYSP